MKQKQFIRISQSKKATDLNQNGHTEAKKKVPCMNNGEKKIILKGRARQNGIHMLIFL